MSLMTSIRTAAVMFAMALTASVALADDAGALKGELGRYFPIRAALAADKTEGVKEHATELAKSQDKEIAKAAEAVAAAKDIASARRAFGDLSRALIASLESATRAGADVGTVYVFECDMAKPYGRWLQAEAALGNPYYGSEMLRCGKRIAVIGAAAGDGESPR